MRASESDRALICPASLVLPRTREKTENAQKAANWGTLCHYWKETGEVEMPGASEKDVLCLEKKILLSGIEREDYWSLGQHEVSFALHLTTCKLQLYPGYGKAGCDRDAWKKGFSEEWLTGTIDYLREGEGWLDDLKTGRWPVDVRTSKQVRSYALMPWVQDGMRLDWTIEATITTWERYPLAGLPTRQSCVLNGWDLSDHLEDLRYAVDHPDETRETEEGCRFCDSRPNCPEWAWATAPLEEERT